MKNSLAWKSIISRIHPPLPLDRRDAEKLLSLFNSSFQQRLDLQHPPVQSVTRSPDTHLFSILSNPMFSVNPTRPRSRSSALKNDGNPGNLAQIQYSIHEPLDRFKDQISSGTATLNSAKVCLRLQIQKALTSSKSEPFELLKSSNTLPVVMSWLWSAGIREKTFLNDKNFPNLIMPFLVLEGREDLIWGWVQSLERLIQKSPLAEESAELRKTQARVVFERLLFETLDGKGLDSAIQIFVQCSIEALCSRTALQRSASFLIRRIIKHHRKAIAGNVRIEPLIVTISNWSVWPGYHLALLELYTNEHPDASRALRWLQKLDDKEISAIPWLKGGMRLQIVHMCLRSAELLLSKTLDSDAMWVMEFLQNNFAEDLSISTPGKIHSEEVKGHGADEESTLQLLGTLAIH